MRKPAIKPRAPSLGPRMIDNLMAERTEARLIAETSKPGLVGNGECSTAGGQRNAQQEGGWNPSPPARTRDYRDYLAKRSGNWSRFEPVPKEPGSFELVRGELREVRG